jgi:hypothetical protein
VVEAARATGGRTAARRALQCDKQSGRCAFAAALGSRRFAQAPIALELEPRESKMAPRAALLGVLVAAPLLALLWLRGEPSPLEAHVRATEAVSWPVERVKWPEGASLKALMETASWTWRPVVFWATPADQWPARNLWTPDFLSAVVPSTLRLDTLHASSSEGAQVKGLRPTSIFSPPALAPLAALAETLMDSELRPETRPAKMSMSEFWARAQARDATHYAFLKTSLARLPPAFAAHTQPRGAFLASWREYNDVLSAKSVGKDNDVWMGSAGVRSHWHYDLQHNMYAQIYGHKQFCLVAPEHWHRMYLFPSLDGRYRMSQPHPDAADIARFPDYPPELRTWPRGGRSALLHCTTLAPGDVLYIPPFWFHSGLSLSSSISFSTVSRSDEEALVERLEGLPLPLHAHWTLAQRAVALRHYLTRTLLAAKIASNASVSAWVGELVRSRWAPLIGDRGQAEETRELSASMAAAQQPRDSIDGSTHVLNAAELLRRIRDRGAREITAANYVEETADTALGTEWVYPFLAAWCAVGDGSSAL